MIGWGTQVTQACPITDSSEGQADPVGIWQEIFDSVVPTKENPLGAAGSTLPGNVQQSQAQRQMLRVLRQRTGSSAAERVQVCPLVTCYVSLGHWLVILTSLD